jgi:nicotinate-nucleotide adenylyltransferase
VGTGFPERIMLQQMTSTVQHAPPSHLHADHLRIGLLGGSFNPAHEAHRVISLFALKRLKLDRVWWLVSPGNPLKDLSALPDLAARISAAQKITRDPRIAVTGIEAEFRTRYTVDTIAKLRRRFPRARFVWLMGADNLSQFSRWRDWQTISALLPMAVIDRPSDSLRASASIAAQRLARYRLDEAEAQKLADCAAPAWVFLRGLKLPLSSTQLRADSRR